MEDDRRSSQLRPPLSGCDCVGGLAAGGAAAGAGTDASTGDVATPPSAAALLQCQVLWQGTQQARPVVESAILARMFTHSCIKSQPINVLVDHFPGLIFLFWKEKSQLGK